MSSSTGQLWLPGSAPASIAGSRPARSSDDFPLPDGPPMTSADADLQPADELVDQLLPAEEQGGVLRLERGEALVRAGRARLGDA